jgi:hypothetical protein
MTISITRLYELLGNKLGKTESEALTTYIEEMFKDEFNNQSPLLATKLDIGEIKLEIEKLRTELHSSLRGQLWAIIALFFPLYLTIILAVIHLK